MRYLAEVLNVGRVGCLAVPRLLFPDASILYWIVGIIGVFSALVYPYAKRASDEQAAEEKARQEAEQRAKEAQALVDGIYTSCLERGVGSIETEKDKALLRLVAQNAGVNDFDRALEIFEKGKKDYAVQVEEQRKKDEEEYRKKRKEVVPYQEKLYQEEAAKRHSHCGKNKYLLLQCEMYDSIVGSVNRSKNQSSQSIPHLTAKTTDPYIMGGLAAGLAGTGAGLAAASSIARSNAREEARIAEINKRIDQLNSVAWLNHLPPYYPADVEEYAKFLVWFRQKLGEVLVMDVDTKDYADAVQLKASYSRYTGGNSYYIEVFVQSSMTTLPTLLDRPAILDGWYGVEVYREGELVGRGNYSPNMEARTDLPKLGFAGGMEKIMIQPAGEYDLSGEEQYTFKFIPQKMWLVEAQDLSDYPFEHSSVREAATKGKYRF